MSQIFLDFRAHARQHRDSVVLPVMSGYVNILTSCRNDCKVGQQPACNIYLSER